MVMYKGGSCTAAELEKLVKTYCPPGTKLKVNTPYNKGAVITMPDGTVISGKSNAECKRNLLKWVNGEGQMTLFALPPQLNSKSKRTRNEKQWARAICELRAAVQITGEPLECLLFDENRVPIGAITTGGTYYSSGKRRAGGGKRKPDGRKQKK